MEFLEKINQVVLDNKKEIDSWIEWKKSQTKIPFYTSVDLRVSKNKIAAVDTNIFPAGFNNLCERFLSNAFTLTKDYKKVTHKSKIRKVLIIPELHTRNPFYWDNILSILNILKNAGLEARVGVISEKKSVMNFKSSSTIQVAGEPVVRKDNRLLLSDFDPDIILINNDFSDSSPPILSNLEQIVTPPPEVGWHSRKKNIHFEFYYKLVSEFSELINMDPFHFSLRTQLAENINFEIIEDRERLANLSNKMLHELSVYHNMEHPILFIKSNTGTYGMSVMQIDKGKDIIDLNRDGRKKMKVSKGGNLLKEVVIQEGVETIYSNKEPVYYLINGELVGGFYRVNDLRSSVENLNTKGMYFQCLCLDKGSNNCQNFLNPALETISKIGSLATGYEIDYLLKKN